MVSIALGIFIFGIGYVIFWSVRNDNVSSIEEQNGFIKMPDPASHKRKIAAKLGRGRMRRAQKGRMRMARRGRNLPAQQARWPQGPQS